MKKCPHSRTVMTTEGVTYCLDCQTVRCGGYCSEPCVPLRELEEQLVVDT